MAQNPATQYSAELTQQLWRHQQEKFAGRTALFDEKYSSLPNPPVFTREHADLNVLVPEDPTLAAEVLALVPLANRHKWFRSMKSSQALALSVFGNLKVLGRTECLSWVEADDGAGLAFGAHKIRADAVQLEHEVESLHEIRPTSIDVWVSQPTVACVECKLSEREVGRCSRPRLPSAHSEHCDGSYRRQAGRTSRCALTERVIAYWDHIPRVLRWQADQDHIPCPLAEPYQLVRNVLAAYVENDKVNTVRGHALLVYDARNPAFQPRDAGSFETLRGDLHDASLLRRCSWQAILGVMADHDDLRWLVERVGDKYGLAPTK
jgi:hypothetical protein